MITPHRPSRLADFFDSYTKDLTAEDLQRLFTRDTRDAYKFFTRHRDPDAMQRMPWYRRVAAEVWALGLVPRSQVFATWAYFLRLRRVRCRTLSSTYGVQGVRAGLVEEGHRFPV